VGPAPEDPVGDALAAAVLDVVQGATVSLAYSPEGAPAPLAPIGPGTANAVGDGPPGWQLTLSLALSESLTRVIGTDGSPLATTLDALPAAALRAGRRFRGLAGPDDDRLGPALRRSLRDLVVVELLHILTGLNGGDATSRLLEEILDYLIELSGTRVESHDLTHGVVVTDVLHDLPRLQFAYPSDLRQAKRGPLLFDGQRAVLIVDRHGLARTELQRHHLDRLMPGTGVAPVAVELTDSGTLVAATTDLLGGVGFFLRSDRTIWVFVEGRPLVVRRGEHWSAFPLELSASISEMIGGGPAADLVVQTAFVVSAQRRGAILAIVDGAGRLDDVVSPKDRYDLRNSFDPQGMRVETRLHHLIDARELDPLTLARLAALDGATVLDAQANLLAYGAIVASADSQHEGARTAAAKTLSKSADVVLKVSVDGDITVFRGGVVIATLLGQGLDPDRAV
jgi:hypothetical protein